MDEQKIVTPCPSCGGRTLFIGTGGHLTCSWLECKEPVVRIAIDQLKKEKNVLRRLLRAEGHNDAGIDTFVESYLSPLEALQEIGKIPGMQDALREE